MRMPDSPLRRRAKAGERARGAEHDPVPGQENPGTPGSDAAGQPGTEPSGPRQEPGGLPGRTHGPDALKVRARPRRHLPGVLRPSLPAMPGVRVLLKYVRELLTRHRPDDLLVSAGAVIIGGPAGQDYQARWYDDMKSVTSSRRRLAEAVSFLLGSPELRWVTRTAPALQRRFPRLHAAVCGYLAFASRSRLSACVTLTLPLTPGMAAIAFMIGGLAGGPVVAWAAAMAVILEIPLGVDRWQRERALAERALQAARHT